MSETTPRITAPYLENFTHQIVRILGKVTQLRGENATVDAGGQISLHLSRVNMSPYSCLSREQIQNRALDIDDIVLT